MREEVGCKEEEVGLTREVVVSWREEEEVGWKYKLSRAEDVVSWKADWEVG